MASASSSRETRPSVSTVTFPRARVYWLTKKGRNEPRYAWICVSTSLRWIFVDSHDSAIQLDLSSFRGHFCLSMERMEEGAAWDEVEEKVTPIDEQLGPAFAVNGKLSGPDVSRVKSRLVRLVLVCDSAEKMNTLMEAVRILIAPWQLLHKRMKEVLLDPELSAKALKALSICAGEKPGAAEHHDRLEHCIFVDTMEKGAAIAEGVNFLCGYVETVATVVKKSVPVAKDVAEEVADFAKCVSIVGSAVQVVVMCATLAEMGMEMKRGKVEWPRIRSRVKHLHGVVLECMSHVLHPDGDVDELLVKNVFKVQQELFDMLGEVEEEMMRDSGPLESVKRFVKASKLKRVEEELERLEGCVLEAIQSSSIADIRRDVKELKQKAYSLVDTFKPFFDSPSLPRNPVFDFESFDNEGAHNTPEGILLNSVLQLGDQGNSEGTSALGTHGMGGVGKTTALKKICSAEQVRSLFVDGVCFMQFGQDATLQKVREEICRCIRNFGGVEIAKDMESVANLGNVVNRAAEWLKCKAVLLVCDDLWATGDNELGYVPELKRLFRDAPKSGLLISTRDRTIALAVSSSPVSFECVEPQGSKAREILGRTAFGVDWQDIVSNWDAESDYEEILDVCAGLPLALGIAGSGVHADYEDSRDGEGRKDSSFAVKNYRVGLKEGSVKTLAGANVDYHRDGLKYVVAASLKLCQEWGRSGGRNYDMARLFRSLCILEKQQFLPESTLKLYWRLERLDGSEVREVVRKFADLNLVRRERVDSCTVKKEQFCVRLHDLVLELCKKMEVDEQQKWHIGLVNGYRSVLEDGKVMETGSGAWWKMEDDGHLSTNLSRHLVASGYWKELEALLCDVRWTLRRYEMGGWAALDLDFRRLIAYEGGSETHRIRKLHLLLKRNWDWLRSDQSLFAFYVFGHLSKQERQERYISEYLKSVTEHFPSPWLCPLAKCVGPEDNRESSLWNIGAAVWDLGVSWAKDRVAVASYEGIDVWSLSRQEELFKISIDRKSLVRSVALSEDAKIIVSGHQDGTVRRWNVHTGESIGEPMSGHTKASNSVAIRENLIVSGSKDRSIYRWNATTGESIGSALQGHGGSVSCVAVSANGKLIVSGSRDGTIRRWDAGTGDPVGFPLIAHDKGVTSLAIGSDGELLVSGHENGTVRRWRARTGEAFGQPHRGHNFWINYVAVSEDGNRIVSCSGDGDVRLWDALSGDAIGIPLRGHRRSVTCAAISRDGKLVLSGSMDRTVRQWDVSAERNVIEQQLLLTSLDEKRSYSIPRSIVSLSVCANGKLVVSGSEDSTVQRWDMLTGEALGRPMLRYTCKSCVYAVAISRDGTLMVSGDSHGIVRRWDASTGEAIGEPMDGHSDIVSSAVISDDGKLIVTGSGDKTVRMWDARTGEAIGKPMKGHLYGILSLAISTDGNLIVSGSYLGSMRRWDARTGEQIGDDIKVPGWAENVVLSIDGKTIACGSRGSNYVQKWETMTGKPICEPMKWSEGKHMLDEMERARLCGYQEYDAVVRRDTLPTEMRCRAVCPDKKKIVLGLKNGSVAVCERR